MENLQDLREYSDRELSLICSNDEYLYNEMQKSRSFALFTSMLNEFYLYTGDQLADLEETFKEENSWINE